MLRSFCVSSFPTVAPCRSALFPLPPASKPSMSPGSHRGEQKTSLVLPCSSAPRKSASRFFPLQILSQRSTKNALSISTPAPPRSGFATSTDRSPFSLALIITNLPLSSVPSFLSASLELCIRKRPTSTRSRSAPTRRQALNRIQSLAIVLVLVLDASGFLRSKELDSPA